MATQASRIPTLDKLGASVPPDLDARKVASVWFEAFVSHVESGSIDEALSLFVEDAYWRDILVLTWDFRTFDGATKIKQFLTDRLPAAKLHAFKLQEFVELEQPYPDLGWIVAMFSFESDIGIGSGVFHLVPTASGEWKAHTMFTNLEDLRDYPEAIGLRRSRRSKPGAQWAAERRQELEFEGNDPTVLVIGGGQNGLELAARLKFLNVPVLVVEAHNRIGDNWRKRYDKLCLHWPIWYDHMPYIPFPPTWPLYTPSLKMADWLESYAQALELNVWTSTVATQATQGPDKRWSVVVKRGDGSERTFHVNHLVFATGLGDATPNMPAIAQQERFKGTVMHSSHYKNSIGYGGKKVIVIGAGNSAHDVAADLAADNIDVTMYQRSATYVMNLDKQWKYIGGRLYSEGSPPIDVADRLANSLPHLYQENGPAQRAAKLIAEADKELRDKLQAVGFKLNLGEKDAGIHVLLKTKGGGHYFDTGASQLIIDGKIKIKNGCMIERFTETGLMFDDGSELSADVVICATGIGDTRNSIRSVCGDEIANACKPIWGLDEEGELRGSYRDLGIPGLWYAMGSLVMTRFHSKHLALQIKAIETGVFSTRYSLDD
ncbi:FAD/NAD-binding domain-containing protein [Sparassis crispa]|uniref:FAD/NAD-binding domain-containing protein n=1 Tax=Sparassis crispa TaxID=139825 RepID=A0A401H4Y4_9APHY|nr:FAD/NAD-binding domain-containing protein [Sparassis crispa]GBE89505.1 FAD/NAD-binding domain-containing protein [Sparassis crispa]